MIRDKVWGSTSRDFPKKKAGRRGQEDGEQIV